MKSYVYPLMIVILSVFVVTTLDAQDETKKIKVKIIKEENGIKKTVEKTFNSLEEMKNDPEMASLPIDQDEWMEKENIVVYELDSAQKDSHIYINSSKDGDGKVVVKVRKLKDGETQIIRDSPVIELTGKAGKSIRVIMNEASDRVENSGNGYAFKYKSDGEHYWVNDGKNVVIIKDSLIAGSGDGKHHVFVIKGNKDDNNSDEDFFVREDGEGSKIKITIKRQIITIKDFEPMDKDISQFNLKGKRPLDLDNLNYYPNPNSGKFTLNFKAKRVATEIRIVDTMGRLLYNEMLREFDGIYSKRIDLTDVKPGIYILQLIQGKKALNKKLVVE